MKRRRLSQLAAIVAQRKVHGALKERAARVRSLDETPKLLEERLAIVRDAAVHALQLQPRQNQLLAALLINAGCIVELATGEGKSLVGALASVCAWLRHDRTHVITTNDFLARRDATDLAPLYDIVGATSAHITLTDFRLQAEDITYASTHALVFSHLRDQRAVSWLQQCTRPADCLIVDEADSILLDSALSPFVLGIDERDTEAHLYARLTPLIEQLRADADFRVDGRSVSLTEEGTDRLERLLRTAAILGEAESLYDEGRSLAHHVRQSLLAKAVYVRGRDYVVEDNQVTIVDRFTGRTNRSRRWSAGLHQAIEAKERLPIRPAQNIGARTSIRAFVSRFSRIGGMTGTTAGVREELRDAYGTPVELVASHQPSIRIDEPDRHVATAQEKARLISDDVAAAIAIGQPVLIGTSSEAEARFLSEALDRGAIPHATLTARNHASEAAVCAAAGQPGAVTVATQLAGRGTDIELADEATGAGGLLVIGFSRHVSKRVDDQLRGRAGRRGQPGVTRFYVSDDDFIFARGDDRNRTADVVQREHERDAAVARSASRTIEAIRDEQQRAFYALRQRIVDGRGEQTDQSIRERIAPLLAELTRELEGQKLRKRLYIRFGVRVESEEPLDELSAGLRWQANQLRGFFWALMQDIASEAVGRERVELHRELLGVSAEDPSTVESLVRPWLMRLNDQLSSVAPRLVLRHFRLVRLRELDRAWMNHLRHSSALRDQAFLDGQATGRPRDQFRKALHDAFADELADARMRIFRSLAPTLSFGAEPLQRRIQTIRNRLMFR